MRKSGVVVLILTTKERPEAEISYNILLYSQRYMYKHP